MADTEMSFVLQHPSNLLESLNVIHNFEPQMVTVKVSGAMIVVIFCTTDGNSDYMVAFRLLSSMFTEYTCSSSTDFFCKFAFQRLRTMLNDMLAEGFGSFTVSITDPLWADFAFHRDQGPDRIEVLPLIPTSNEYDICDYNVDQHVIIRPDQFLHIVGQFAEYNTVLVKVMDGQIEFSQDQCIQIYDAKRDECTIGRTIENSELSFSIGLNPKEPLIELARSAQSVVFYKAVNSSDGVIEFLMNGPIGFLIYKPQ